MKSLLIIGLAFGLAACSDSKQKEATINRDKEPSPFVENSSKRADTKTKENTYSSNTYKEAESNNKSVSYSLSSFSPSGSSTQTYSQGSYTVNQDDTLMKIAFEIYGDYEKWRVIKDSNSENIGPENIITEGMTLTFPEPAEKFTQNKNGDAYLIKRGDTLTSISRKTYGTSRHWKAIWKNNTPLIKDPNKIFAGFTIYTPVINN